MKAAYENVEILKGSQAYVAYSFTAPFFPFKWHYHPEYELTLITKGSGKRIIGDSHQPFSQGDLILCGSGLPHTWSSEPLKNQNVSAVVIQFSAGFIGDFVRYGECKSIRQMLEKCGRGLFFNDQIATSTAKSIVKLPAQNGVAKITSLLKILQKLADSTPQELSSAFYTARRSQETENRINKVCSFVQDRATENISIDEVSKMVHLSKSAFCKFFKRTMRTSFSDYLNDIRIAKACYLLSDTDKPVREIAMESGFDSLTYFNRVFLRKKSRTPSAFRKNHRL